MTWPPYSYSRKLPKAKPSKGENIRESHPRWTHAGKPSKGENIRWSHPNWTLTGEPSKGRKLINTTYGEPLWASHPKVENNKGDLW